MWTQMQYEMFDTESKRDILSFLGIQMHRNDKNQYEAREFSITLWFNTEQNRGQVKCLVNQFHIVCREEAVGAESLWKSLPPS